MTGLPLCTGLVRFAAANIAGLVGHLSLRGLSLQFVECFQSRIQSVDLTGCASLIRLCLAEQPRVPGPQPGGLDPARPEAAAGRVAA